MPLKVLILTHSFSPTTETFIYHDAVALQQHAKVKVGCFYRENELSRPFHPLQVLLYQRNWVQQKWQNLLYKFNIQLHFRHAPLRKELQKLLDEFQPDIVHLHFGIQAIHFLDNMEFAGPVFITFHGYDATKIVKKSTIYRHRLRALFEQNNVFPLATSASLFNYLAQYQLQSPRRQVAYSGIDLDLFSPGPDLRREGMFVFTQISSFRPKKGHRFLLRAFRQLLDKYPDRSFQLILAGGGPLEPEIKALTADLGLQDRVDFPGWISQTEAVTLLRGSDVFVHPSITDEHGDMESTTVSILEAMAMELPIFATRHSGIPEIVEHGVNGLLAAEKNIDEYVSCLETLASWGRQPQNRQKIVDRFSRQAHIRALLDVYRDALLMC